MQPLNYEPPRDKKKADLTLGQKSAIGEIIVYGTIILLGAVTFGALVVWDWLRR
jgi:hypothetical protein